MDIAVLIAVIVNVGLLAFSYGKLTQRVNDINRRLDNDIKHHFDEIEKRLDRIEKLLMR